MLWQYSHSENVNNNCLFWMILLISDLGLVLIDVKSYLKSIFSQSTSAFFLFFTIHRILDRILLFMHFFVQCFPLARIFFSPKVGLPFALWFCLVRLVFYTLSSLQNGISMQHSTKGIDFELFHLCIYDHGKRNYDFLHMDSIQCRDLRDSDTFWFK